MCDVCVLMSGRRACGVTQLHLKQYCLEGCCFDRSATSAMQRPDWTWRISRYFPDTHERSPHLENMMFGLVWSRCVLCLFSFFLSAEHVETMFDSGDTIQCEKKIPTMFRSQWSINSKASNYSYQFTKYRPVVIFYQLVSGASSSLTKTWNNKTGNTCKSTTITSWLMPMHKCDEVKSTRLSRTKETNTTTAY